MKKMLFKRIIILLCVFLILFSFPGCDAVNSAADSYNKYNEDKEKYFVAFFNDETDIELMDYRKIAGYRSGFSEYSSRVLYKTLNSDEQQIYRFLEYALDNACTQIFIEHQFLEGVDRALEEILYFLSMDSPFVEQNIGCTWYFQAYTRTYLFGLLSNRANGIQMKIERFNAENLEKKKAALEVAKNVLTAVSGETSPMEKAEFFYRYLSSDVKFRDYEEGEEPYYLYDAFCNKATQCDGFANAFSKQFIRYKLL